MPVIIIIIPTIILLHIAINPIINPIIALSHFPLI